MPSQGSFTIGSDGGDDYSSWSSAFAAMTTLTGNLTLTGARAEAIVESTDVTWSVGTSGYTLLLTSNVEVDFQNIANNHYIDFTGSDSITIDEASAGTIGSVIIRNLGIHAGGADNDGILLTDSGITDEYIIVEKNLIIGDGESDWGIYAIYNAECIIIRNNVVRGFSAADGFGIRFNHGFAVTDWHVYNNTVCKCYVNIGDTGVTPGSGTKTMKNNLCQGSGNSDYFILAGFTTGKNVSQDAKSPDVDYRNMNKQSVMTDYTNNDFSLASSDTDLDDGDDLSAIGAPAQFSDDCEGTARSDWYIGAFEYVSAGGTSFNLFDCKAVISSKATNNFDMKAVVSSGATNLFDCKAVILDKTFNLFDYKAQILSKAADLFDCKAVILDKSTGLYDCKATILDKLVGLFDGKAVILNKATDLFDCKAVILSKATELFDCKAVVTTEAFSTNVFDCKAIILSKNMDLYDCKAQILDKLTNLFDCKAVVSSEATSFNSFDCKAVILSKDTNLFDCKAVILNKSTNLFDCKAVIFNVSTDLFDCKAVISSEAADLFDCKVVIKNSEVNLFDCKAVVVLGIPSGTSVYDCIVRIMSGLPTIEAKDRNYSIVFDKGYHLIARDRDYNI